MAVGYLLSIETDSISKLSTFYKQYKTSKNISTDSSNPTTLDSFSGENCQGHNLSTVTGTPSYFSNGYYYQNLTIGDHSLSNPRSNSKKTGIIYNLDGTDVEYIVSGGCSSVKGFAVVRNGTDLECYLAYMVSGSENVMASSTYIAIESGTCTLPTSITQSTTAYITASSWNSWMTWLGNIISESIATEVDSYISIDSASYSEVTDPDDLADAIISAVNDNDYTANFSLEKAVPICLTKTTKTEIDDIYDSIGTNELFIVSVPASSTATGSVKTAAVNSNYVYFCTATDTWARAALYTWGELNILNHGETTGWNSSFQGYVTRQQNSGWTVSDTGLQMTRSSNANLLITSGIIQRGTYTKLHYIAEASGKNGNYNCMSIGFRRKDYGVPSNYYSCSTYGVTLIDYNSQTNVDGTSPWYSIEKKERVWDITSIPADLELRLCVHCCDCGGTFYSIWLTED